MQFWPFLREKTNPLDAVISAYESETAAVFVRTAPRNEHAILLSLVGIVVLSLCLMSFSQLDMVVSGTGRVVPINGQFYITPPGQQIIKDIRVHTGDVVRKGQILATVDPTVAAADLVQMQQKVSSDEAMIDRLRAEINNQSYKPAGTSPYELLQLSLWRQRQADLESSVSDFDARIANQEATVNAQQHDIENYQKRLDVATQLEQMQTRLEQEGAGSKANVLTTQDNRLELNRLLTSDQGQIVAARQLTLSLRAQRADVIEKWRSDAASQLVQTNNDLDFSRDSLKKALLQKDLVNIVSPSDAVVLKVGNASTGSVSTGNVDSGSDPLFVLVPLKGPVEASIDISASDIGFLSPGDTVQIKLDAYRYLYYGTAKGVLESISKGSFRTDDVTGQPTAPYYQARVRFTDIHLRNVPPNFAITPGMTLVADILVGHRSVISYIVESVLHTGHEAMREP